MREHLTYGAQNRSSDERIHKGPHSIVTLQKDNNWIWRYFGTRTCKMESGTAMAHCVYEFWDVASPASIYNKVPIRLVRYIT